MTLWILLIALSFLSGSIPFGLLIARKHGIDIRQHGSKNIGATNVRRVVGSGAGNLCLALDIAKGLIPTLTAGLLQGTAGASDLSAQTAWWWLGVMVAAVLGHMFSPWVGFKGGKGVATGLGSLLGLFPYLTLPAFAAVVVWIAAVKATRYVGVSSCLAAISLPAFYLGGRAVLGLGEDPLPFLAVTITLALLVVIKHRGNLIRTYRGTEPRTGRSSPSTR